MIQQETYYVRTFGDLVYKLVTYMNKSYPGIDFLSFDPDLIQLFLDSTDASSIYRDAVQSHLIPADHEKAGFEVGGSSYSFADLIKYYAEIKKKEPLFIYTDPGTKDISSLSIRISRLLAKYRMMKNVN